MSGNGAWYGGDEPTAEQPLVPRPVVPQPRTAAEDDVPLVPQPLTPPFDPAAPPARADLPQVRADLPQVRADLPQARADLPPPRADLPPPRADLPPAPADLPPPFPASMYSADGDVVDQDPPSYPAAPGGQNPGGYPAPAAHDPAGQDPPTATIPRIGSSGEPSVQLSAIELTTDARLNEATETAAPPARNRRDLSAAIAIALVILMVLCIGVAGSSFQVLSQASEKFEQGTCVAPDGEGRLPYRQVACTDPGFTHVVVGVLDRDADHPCRSVPGASTLFSTNATVVCLGAKGVDPSRSVNIVRQGDCVNVDGANALLIDCRDPKAKYQVVKRLTDVPEGASGACDGVEGVVETFQWNWKSNDPVDRSENGVDVVLCLGPSQSSIDAEAAARAAASTCRFLTDAEVSATVSAATSKTYTVSERVDDGTHCAYQFSKPNEIVRVGFFSGAKLNPENDSETMTIDGLRAAWVPGRGKRSLGVELPTGTIYIKVQLSGVGDTTSRKLAIDAFKSARSRIR
jgi:hypothetical protein